MAVGFLLAGGAAIDAVSSDSFLGEKLLTNRAAALTSRTRLCLNHFFQEALQELLTDVILVESKSVGKTMSQALRFLQGQFQLYHRLPFVVTSIS